MRAQEKVVKITETVIAVRAGTKYHRTGCGHLRNHTVAAGTAKDFSPCWDCFPEKVLVTDREYRNVKCYGLAACVASWFQPGKPRNFVPVDDEPRNTQRGSDAVAGPWPLATTTAATTTTRRSRKNLPLEMVEPSRMRAVGE